MLPDWLNGNDPAASVSLPPKAGIRPKKTFWRRTLHALADVLEKEVLADASANNNGFLQKADPRAKLISAALLTVSITLLHTIPFIVASIALSVILAVFTRINMRAYAGAMLPVTLLTTAIAFPSVFAFITPGKTVVYAGIFSITGSGIYTAVRFTTGSLACVSVTALLILTTHWTSLLSSLEAFRVPRIFILILLMTYRYLFIFIRNAEEVHLAKASRTISTGKTTFERRWLAARAGDMFVKSRRLADQVYLTMTSRGFSGEARTIERFTWDRSSTFILVISLIYAVALPVVERITAIR